MEVKYEALALEIFKRGIKKIALANALGITTKALNNKIKGVTLFTWEQACIIQKNFFPDISKDVLFQVSENFKRKRVS